ncbi:hypothetical protein SAMN04515674_10575 [Pseudarcicella hirudinis]|uniref:Uncharacterized protein n=1 Tax=Pseudarcicella hirudinis TaxID=1079859 RepID=A0A1I5SKV0_9BACT|nr:hypothetical protein SAMN04515674_10575 [Pseudarcicella hirudinis]
MKKLIKLNQWIIEESNDLLDMMKIENQLLSILSGNVKIGIKCSTVISVNPLQRKKC